MKTWLPLLLALVLGALLWSVVVGSPEPEIITLPGSTDTVTVTRTQLDTIQQVVFRDRIREVVTTDTLVLTDTLFVTEPVRVTALDRHFIDTLTVGQRLGDTTFLAGTRITVDSAGVERQDIFGRYITLGPLRSATADSSGFSLDFGEFASDEDCGFWCKARIGAIGGAVVAILTLVF